MNGRDAKMGYKDEQRNGDPILQETKRPWSFLPSKVKVERAFFFKLYQGESNAFKLKHSFGIRRDGYTLAVNKIKQEIWRFLMSQGVQF